MLEHTVQTESMGGGLYDMEGRGTTCGRKEPQASYSVFSAEPQHLHLKNVFRSHEFLLKMQREKLTQYA